MRVMTRKRAATDYSRSYWWLQLLHGSVAVLVGIALIALPGHTLTTLVFFFGAFILVDGIVAASIALFWRKDMSRRWLLLVGGIVCIALGVITIAWPHITTLILIYLVAAWAIVLGVISIGTAFSLGRAFSFASEWTLISISILSLLLGLLLFLRPFNGTLTLVLLIGIYALLYGVLLLIQTFQYRSAVAA